MREKFLRLAFISTVLVLLLANGILTVYESGRVLVDVKLYNQLTEAAAKKAVDQSYTYVVRYNLLDVLKHYLRNSAHKRKPDGNQSR